MNFDRAAAKAAGYTDEEIDAYLKSAKPKAPAVPRAAAETTTAPARRAQPTARAAEPEADRMPMAAAIPAAIANVSRDIPGAEAAQAFVRSLVRRQPYGEALQDIRQATSALPAAVRIPTRMAGSALATAVAPGRTLARQGAAYGAAMGATEASPEVDVTERAMRAAGQAAGGALAGKAVDVAGTAVRARLSPTAEQVLLKQRGAQQAAATPKFEAFRDLGDLAENIQSEDQLAKTLDVLELPVVRRAINLVKNESPRLNKLPDTDAQVLDAAYKRLGQKAFKSATGFETKEAAQALSGMMDELSGGQYTPALEAFKAGAKRIEATERGAAMVAAGQRPSKATLKSAQERSIEAIPEFARRASAEERKAAVQGALGELRQFGLYDLFSPVGIGFRGTPSLVPGARRAIRAANLINALEGQALGARVPVQRLATPAGVRELGRAGMASYMVPGGRR